MGGFSFWHILILAIILLLLFGGNRFSNMMGDVAKGLKSFKQGMAEDEDEKRREEQRRADPRPLPRSEPIDVTPSRAVPPTPCRQPETIAPTANSGGDCRRCSASIPANLSSSRSSR
ncbi:twin-arginine translocase TatA/TatE family subunit [Sphingomonas daechungensis]|uniref:Sec-independent protein translocase protein TatA n=1 Tax=Sphingomonas daechungensis TaxID=1176646 RepID=A0ABX6T4L7_9SPHN|nr:twin-arginine translocase TatA/TatE family subunit [Sphingomonas daechungensis]QNP43658.1 twin-arginine translocase TatA/TatE family subunit [Sphingomonas daechungensis]